MSIVRADEVRKGDTVATWGKVFAINPNWNGKVIITCGIHNGDFEPSDPIELTRRFWKGQRGRLNEEERRRGQGVAPIWRKDAPLATAVRLAYITEYGDLDQ